MKATLFLAACACVASAASLSGTYTGTINVLGESVR